MQCMPSALNYIGPGACKTELEGIMSGPMARLSGSCSKAILASCLEGVSDLAANKCPSVSKMTSSFMIEWKETL
eukprot:8302501-Lingulodinium_polyedra.AAC.1